jgi:hypothetical protein
VPSRVVGIVLEHLAAVEDRFELERGDAVRLPLALGMDRENVFAGCGERAIEPTVGVATAVSWITFAHI